MAISRRTFLSWAGGMAVGAGLSTSARFVADQVDEDDEQHVDKVAAFHPDRTTPPKRYEGRAVWGVETTEKVVALTFDDGPMPDWTPRVLEVLSAKQAPATFFVRGDRVEANSE